MFVYVCWVDRRWHAYSDVIATFQVFPLLHIRRCSRLVGLAKTIISLNVRIYMYGMYWYMEVHVRLLDLPASSFKYVFTKIYTTYQL